MKKRLRIAGHSLTILWVALGIYSCQQEEFVESVEFGANMQVSLINDGPVTIVIDTKDRQ